MQVTKQEQVSNYQLPCCLVCFAYPFLLDSSLGLRFVCHRCAFVSQVLPAAGGGGAAAHGESEDGDGSAPERVPDDEDDPEDIPAEPLPAAIGRPPAVRPAAPPVPPPAPPPEEDEPPPAPPAPAPPGEVEPPPAPPPGAGGRKRRRDGEPGVPWRSWVIGDWGTIVYDEAAASLNAHCSVPAHGPLCRANKIVARLPLGYLVAWLQYPHLHEREHRLGLNHAMYKAWLCQELGYSRRRDGRKWLVDRRVVYADLLAIEEARHPPDSFEEPLKIRH